MPSEQLGYRKTPPERLRTVPWIANYADLSPPLVADSTDYGARMREPWGVLGNDDYGDCVFAAMAHTIQCHGANVSGEPRRFTDAEVLGWYSEVTGFDPSDPSTDQGAYPLDALQWFQRRGEVLAYGRVDPRNDAHVAMAIAMFGGIYTGWDLPRAWQGRNVWDVGPSLTGVWAPGSWGGHMTNQIGYHRDASTPTVTWGRVVQITAAARHAYCAEAYAVITPAWLDRFGSTIQGFDLTGLRARLTVVA